jgi:hypothetical protein
MKMAKKSIVCDTVTCNKCFHNAGKWNDELSTTCAHLSLETEFDYVLGKNLSEPNSCYKLNSDGKCKLFFPKMAFLEHV